VDEFDKSIKIIRKVIKNNIIGNKKIEIDLSWKKIITESFENDEIEEYKYKIVPNINIKIDGKSQ
jgi:dynactin complex subunit